MTLLITEDDVRKLPLSPREAIPIVEDSFHWPEPGASGPKSIWDDGRTRIA